MALAEQDGDCALEFRDLVDGVVKQLLQLGLIAKLYWDNVDSTHTVSLVPTSAMSGEGMPDLLKVPYE